MRTTARVTLMLLLALVTAFVAGCGSDDDSPSRSSGADRAASTKAEDADRAELGAAIDAKLEIQLEDVNGKDFQGIPVPGGVACTKSSPATCQGTLECPAATDDAGKLELCDWLATTGSKVLLAEVDPAMACTQQYGGPEVATVTGTVGETKIDATFSREDGCAIARFDEASPLWTGEVPDATAPVDGGSAAAGSCLALPPDAPVSSEPSTPPVAGGTGAADSPADSAADEACATPATMSPTPAPGTPPLEPEIISDPPEAFELEK